MFTRVSRHQSSEKSWNTKKTTEKKQGTQWKCNRCLQSKCRRWRSSSWSHANWNIKAIPATSKLMILIIHAPQLQENKKKVISLVIPAKVKCMAKKQKFVKILHRELVKKNKYTLFGLNGMDFEDEKKVEYL